MIKIKAIIPATSTPAMKSGAEWRSSAVYGIMRDNVQIGVIRSNDNGGLWYVLENNYRPHKACLLGFMKFKDAKAWAIANMGNTYTNSEEAAVPGLRDLFRGF